MATIKGTTENFEELTKEGLVLVDFYATWCGPCMMIAQSLDELSEDYKVIKVDVEENKELADKYGVMSIPTLIVFNNGEEKKSSRGFVPKELIEDMLERSK